jgi:hypothetical protein
MPDAMLSQACLFMQTELSSKFRAKMIPLFAMACLPEIIHVTYVAGSLLLFQGEGQCRRSTSVT